MTGTVEGKISQGILVWGYRIFMALAVVAATTIGGLAYALITSGVQSAKSDAATAQATAIAARDDITTLRDRTITLEADARNDREASAAAAARVSADVGSLAGKVDALANQVQALSTQLASMQGALQSQGVRLSGE